MNKSYLVLDIETTGLSPLYGDEITTICMKYVDGNKKKFYRLVNTDGEIKLLNQFIDATTKINPDLIITKNGMQFDIPFIYERIARIIPFADSCVPNYFLDKDKQIDLQKIIGKRLTLDELATLYCTKRKKTGTGSNAITLYKERKLKELVKYCMDDVLLTEEIYLKYKMLQDSSNSRFINK